MFKKAFIIGFFLFLPFPALAQSLDLFANLPQNYEDLGCTGNLEEIGDCVTKKAVEDNNPWSLNFCNFIRDYPPEHLKSGYGPVYSKVENCKKEVAISQNNIELCVLLKSNDHRWAECVSKIAFQLKDFQKCEVIPNQFVRNECYLDLKKLTKDPNLCQFMTSFKEAEEPLFMIRRGLARKIAC